MRKLVPTVGVLLAFAMACGGGDGGEAPVISVEPDAPTEPAEPDAPAEPSEKQVTETISAKVSVPEGQKATITNRGRKEIVSKGKSMGYSRVDNIKVSDPTCTGGTCTATVTGTVTKTVKVEAEDKGEGGEEAENACGADDN